MNSIIFIIRFVFAICYFVLSIRMFYSRYIYAGISCIFIAVVILFPVARMLYKGHKPLPPASIQTDLHALKILAWIRKGIAILSCMTAVGAFQRGKDSEGALILLICIILLTPLDAVVFGQSSPPLLSDTPRPDWRHAVIVLGRNAGLVLYITGVFIFSDHNNTNAAIVLLVSGALLIFARPAILLFAPYK